MDNDITYLTLRRKELTPYREHILQFMLNLTDERETLFIKEYSNEEYQELCENLVETIIFAIIALLEDEIVAVDAFTNGRKELIHKLFPTVSGFVVVSKNLQGKGIGSKLVEDAQTILNKTWAFNLGEVKKNNVSMLRINEKTGWTKVTDDDTLVYFYRPCRKEMKLISPLFWISYWIYLRSKRVRELLHAFF